MNEIEKAFPLLSSLRAILERNLKRLARGESGWAFGYRIHPITKQGQFHNGVDLAETRGTPIYCPWMGTVVKVWSDSLNGNAVRILHTNGLETAYAHLDGWAEGLKEGVVLKEGQRVGYVGTTGRSTGPHLHLCLRQTKPARKDLDPLPYLLEAAGLSALPQHDVG